MKSSMAASCSSNSVARKDSPTPRPFALPSLVLVNFAPFLFSPLSVSFPHADCFVFSVLPLVVNNLSLVTYQQAGYRMLLIIYSVVQMRRAKSSAPPIIPLTQG